MEFITQVEINDLFEMLSNGKAKISLYDLTSNIEHAIQLHKEENILKKYININAPYKVNIDKTFKFENLDQYRTEANYQNSLKTIEILKTRQESEKNNIKIAEGRIKELEKINVELNIKARKEAEMKNNLRLE